MTGNVMAVDYGDKRTGVAFGHSANALVGYTCIINEPRVTLLAAKLSNLAAERDVVHIALGFPLNADGSLGSRALKTQALADMLINSGYEVSLIDERYTSIEARDIIRNNRAGKKSLKKKASRLDEIAASLILQEYFNTTSRAIPFQINS